MESYQDTYKHKGLRKLLVELLSKKGITDPKVIYAISTLPRHFFLPPEFESHAYDDKAFPILEGQTISQPYTVAYQSQLLNLKENDSVLEVGTGSGYQAAVLALCQVNVFSIERHQALSLSAAKLLKFLKLHEKVQLFHGDGTKGLIKHAPYDAIIVTAGAPSIPRTLVSQLKIGGRLVIPVGKDAQVQKMVRLTKTALDAYQTEVFEEFSFVPLLGENAWKP